MPKSTPSELIVVIFLKTFVHLCFVLLAHDGFFIDSFQLQVYSLATSRIIQFVFRRNISEGRNYKSVADVQAEVER